MPTLPPDTSLTFEQVILRVAEECGLAYYDPSSADTPAAIPQDRQVLDKFKRAVNDGMDRLARAYPKWTCLRPQVSFSLAPAGDGPLNIPNAATVAAGDTTPDASIYRLPWYILSQPLNSWHWGSQSSSFSGYARVTTPEEVDRLHRSASATSYPQLAAIIPSPIRGDAGSDRQTKAVRFWPAPNEAFLVTARFLVTPGKMVDLQDRHIFGASHDQTVVAFAVWCFKEHDAKDPGMRATYESRANRALAESIRIDQESVPQDLGSMGDPGADDRVFRQVNPGLDVVTSSMTGVFS